MSTATAPAKPMPVPTPTSQPFWDALRQHRIEIQQCTACSKFVFYPRSNCPFCLSPDLAWKQVSGNGTVYTFTIARRPTAPPFADEVPQKIIVVELEEGVRLTSTLIHIEPEAVKIGMRVKPVFDEIPDKDITLLRYEPA
jgi:uncharacterized protein